MFDILDMGASGLQAQRTRLDTIAGNILHANTTRNERGEKVPYRRRFVVFAPGRADDPSKPGVHVSQVGLDDSAPLQKFEPGHPDADADGYVKYPNIDTATEYVNSIEATRAYEANITMMEVSKQMFNSSLRLIA
ncbi:MAG: flagellar basal-body rod protein FlgC [Phycisphaerales bacterium]|jgi:flagellar basal-body rod protein FlgC|nr:flagellar basal-body rod protein FlgC [Phycisphaerales bacterium]